MPPRGAVLTLRLPQRRNLSTLVMMLCRHLSLKSSFSPLIKQEFGTENEQGEDYEYEDSENKDEGEEEGSDTLSTPTTPTELPQDILRKPIPNLLPQKAGTLCM
jgi:hypothetical protein